MAKLKLYGNLRRLEGAVHRELEVPTVRAALARLTSDNPRLGARLLQGFTLAPDVRITLNGRDIRHLQNLDTPLGPQDELAIFPPLAGG
jgi:sulfur-carrier protein